MIISRNFGKKIDAKRRKKMTLTELAKKYLIDFSGRVQRDGGKV